MMWPCHNYFTICFYISKIQRKMNLILDFVFIKIERVLNLILILVCVWYTDLLCVWEKKKSECYVRFVICTSSNLLLIVLNNLDFRELLVSVRFDGPGWQWSGSFFPDHLGDAQLKMRNSASGVSYMVRVEVQNADLDVHSKKFSGRNNINTGTVLILLSDDKTGFVPYRIDNFSMEVTSLWVCAALASFENWMTIILMITFFRKCGYINRDVNLLKQLFIPTHHVNTLGMSLAILIALLLRYIAFYQVDLTWTNYATLFLPHTRWTAIWFPSKFALKPLHTNGCIDSWRTKFGYIQSGYSQWWCSCVTAIHIWGKNVFRSD